MPEYQANIKPREVDLDAVEQPVQLVHLIKDEICDADINNTENLKVNPLDVEQRFETNFKSQDSFSIVSCDLYPNSFNSNEICFRY